MNASTIDQIFDERFSSIGEGVRHEQRIVIESILSGKNTLALMPTGGGKSLIYWIAGLALGATTVVISPLTALMDEQALKLRDHGLSTLVLHSGMGTTPDQFRRLRKVFQGAMPDFLFTSPERMATDGFLEFVLREKQEQIGLFVIDEIHCISQWGHDFRPFYKEIPPFLNAVFGAPRSWPPVLGLTATLNKKDTEQACSDFHIDSTHVYKSQYLLRYPIHVEVVKVTNEPEKDRLFWDRLRRHRNEKVLVYIDNRKSGDRSTEGLSERARAEGFDAAFFHGDMSSEQKAEVIRQFKAGEVLTVFATSAFGMGIDIPDIRGVIHYRPPESVEQYYQQIGRVGRDGRPAWALLYYSDKNIDFRKKYFIDRSFPTEQEIQEGFARLTAGRGAIQTFNYFGEYEAQAAFHYLLRSEAVAMLSKGIQKIDVFRKSVDEPLPQLDAYQSATRSGITVLAAKLSDTPVQTLMRDLYRWYAQGKIDLERSPSKVLIVEQLSDELPEKVVARIMADASEKKAYRYQLLDELARFLDEYTNSITFHQQIGRYLGVDKFQLNRVHQTVSGEMVRSKSEVIIANLLTRHGIPFRYEERLEAGGYGFWPDFTITANGKTYYWEHLGRLDLDQYRQNWEIKQTWYDEHFPGQMLTTVETSALSRLAEEVIKNTLLQEERPPVVKPDDRLIDGDTDRAIDTEEDISYRIRLWTEGQTDWKHLKTAFRRLKTQERFRNLEIDFQEDEEDMGERELLTMCRTFSRVRQARPVIFLFDRDVNLRDITENGQDYKNWGNNVYSVALPVPEHRADTPAISIEFYYKNEEVMRVDENGRRLFIGTEFNPRTLVHESSEFICADRNKAGKFKIIDDQVYRVATGTDENIALSKNDFAENVLHGVPGFDDFDLSAFVGLFELIEQLAIEANRDAGSS